MERDFNDTRMNRSERPLKFEQSLMRIPCFAKKPVMCLEVWSSDNFDRINDVVLGKNLMCDADINVSINVLFSARRKSLVSLMKASSCGT